MQKIRPNYDSLPYIPTLLAETICSEPYTGAEFSDRSRDSSAVAEIESKRQNMTLEQVKEFANLAEQWCRQAYACEAKWFDKIALSPGDRRAELRMWLTHWLCGYLHNPELFRRKVNRVRPTTFVAGPPDLLEMDNEPDVLRTSDK